MRTVRNEQKTLKQVAKYLNNRYQTHQTAINNDLELKAETTQQFGHYVRLLRTNAGLSRSELAVELNLPEWEIISLENGLVSTIPTHWLHRLAQTFNISVTELSLILGKPIPATPETKLFQFNKNRFSQMLDSFTKVLKSLDVHLVTIGVTSLLLIMTFFPFLWMSDSEIEPNSLIASVPLSNTPTAPIDTGLTYTMEVENAGNRNVEGESIKVNIPTSYEYDRVGNLIRSTICESITYSYDNIEKLIQSTTYKPVTYKYDSIGNLIQTNKCEPITYSYDNIEKLIQGATYKFVTYSTSTVPINTSLVYSSPYETKFNPFLEVRGHLQAESWYFHLGRRPVYTDKTSVPTLSITLKPSENIPIRDNTISYVITITNSGDREALSIALFSTLLVTDVDKIELASSNHINVVIPNHLITYNTIYTIPTSIDPLTIPVIFKSAHEVND